VITQVPPDDLDLPAAQQRHDPLAFLSGRFSGASKRWPIIEKEVFAIITSCDRLDWLLHCPAGFSLFTDHNNLTYVVNPHRLTPGISSHTASKLTRWALKISAFKYTIEHVPGPEKLWSDLLTRWAAPQWRAWVSAVFLAPLAPSTDEGFIWPTAQEIRRVQDAASLDGAGSADAQSTLSPDGVYRLPAARSGFLPAPTTSSSVSASSAILACQGTVA
jgi:RNase H-like domain found in reverse transcriptase